MAHENDKNTAAAAYESKVEAMKQNKTLALVDLRTILQQDRETLEAELNEEKVKSENSLNEKIGVLETSNANKQADLESF